MSVNPPSESPSSSAVAHGLLVERLKSARDYAKLYRLLTDQDIAAMDEAITALTSAPINATAAVPGSPEGLPAGDWAVKAAKALYAFDKWNPDMGPKGLRADIQTMACIILNHAPISPVGAGAELVEALRAPRHTPIQVAAQITRFLNNSRSREAVSNHETECIELMLTRWDAQRNQAIILKHARAPA